MRSKKCGPTLRPRRFGQDPRSRPGAERPGRPPRWRKLTRNQAILKGRALGGALLRTPSRGVAQKPRVLAKTRPCEEGSVKTRALRAGQAGSARRYSVRQLQLRGGPSGQDGGCSKSDRSDAVGLRPDISGRGAEMAVWAFRDNIDTFDQKKSSNFPCCAMCFSPIGIILAGVPAASRPRIGPIAASEVVRGRAGCPAWPETAETPLIRNWGATHTMRFFE